MMSITKKSLLFAFCALYFGGCAYSVHMIHASDFEGSVPYERAKPIIVETSQSVILGIATNSDYVDEAYRKLLSQCSGQITGLTTKYSADLGFFSWTNRVRIEGSCVQP